MVIENLFRQVMTCATSSKHSSSSAVFGSGMSFWPLDGDPVGPVTGDTMFDCSLPETMERAGPYSVSADINFVDRAEYLLVRLH